MNVIGLDHKLGTLAPVADGPETPPDPTGPQPADGHVPKRLRFTAQRWRAYQLFCAGRTRPQVAEELGVTVDTLSSWRRGWRERFGEDFDFATSAIPGVRDAMAIERAAAGPATNPREVAERAAEDLSRIGEEGRKVLLEWLMKISSDRFRIERLTHQEVKVIQQIAADAEIRAAQLYEDASGGSRRGGTTVFAGLTVDTADPSKVGEALTSLQTAFAAFRQDHVLDREEDVIEIGSPAEGS